MRTLPRRDRDDIAETMFLRSRRPDDHREFNALLPWLTPLFVYRMDGDDWVRWSMPHDIGQKMGLSGGCACCGKVAVTDGDVGDFHIDTALRETNWWLLANDYTVTGIADRNTRPAKEEGRESN